MSSSSSSLLSLLPLSPFLDSLPPRAVADVLFARSMATTPVNSGPGKATLKVSSGAAVNQQAAGGCC